MSNFAKITAGEVLSETQFYKVSRKLADSVELINDDGETISVGKEYVDSCLVSASEYTREEKIGKTEAAAKLLSLGGTAITVNFNTKVDEKVVLLEVMKEVNGATLSGIEAAIKKGLKKAINGEARTMVGRHFGEFNDMGRLNFIDMEVAKDPTKPYDNRIRQVNPQTLNYIIALGVKYTVK